METLRRCLASSTCCTRPQLTSCAVDRCAYTSNAQRQHTHRNVHRLVLLHEGHDVPRPLVDKGGGQLGVGLSHLAADAPGDLRGRVLGQRRHLPCVSDVWVPFTKVRTMQQQGEEGVLFVMVTVMALTTWVGAVKPKSSRTMARLYCLRPACDVQCKITECKHAYRCTPCCHTG